LKNEYVKYVGSLKYNMLADLVTKISNKNDLKNEFFNYINSKSE